jgi:ribokinase
MQVLNFGSLNIDHVYTVEHFVEPGETLTSLAYQVNAGGKGLNQSIALSRAGIETFHAGMIGKEGSFLKEILTDANVNTQHLLTGELPTGHAIIQVEKNSGQNSILLYPGANMAIDTSEMLRILSSFPAGNWLLLQNEINDIPFLIKAAKTCGFKVAINPAPCTKAVKFYPLHLCDLIIVNEVEASQLTDLPDPEEAAEMLVKLFPESEIVITLGKAGALYRFKSEKLFVPAHPVTAVDTTSAGDTFTGYFLAAKLRNMNAATAMKCAAFASSITVTRPGAAQSIPGADEVFPFMQ